MPKRKLETDRPQDKIITGMDYHSDTVVGIAKGLESVAFIRITSHGLEHERMSREVFLREFNRGLLYEEWSAIVKFWEIAMRKESNSDDAIALLERMFEMKIKELGGKEMSGLVSMHNDLAKAAGKPEVASFKSIEAAKIAIVKASQVKAKPKTKSAKATGKGQEGRPRSGVGKFAKEQLAKGKTNTEVLEAVKKQFPKNSTTLSCVAYYRAHMVKDGLLKRTEKAPKAKKAAKAKPTKTKAAKKVTAQEPAQAAV